MENFTDTIISSILNSFDSTPVNPTREKAFLSFLVCKNLSDLCETGRAIVNNIESKGNPIDLLPNRDNIALCQQILGKFYSNDMFIEDPNYGNRPNWDIIKNFSRDKSQGAYKIYRALHKNIILKPSGKNIQDAIKRKDKDFFLKNFNDIFSDIPSTFTDALCKFKNFVSCPYTLNEDQTYMWDFFESLLDIFIFEEENLEDLKNL
jgi:hypothetical protein